VAASFTPVCFLNRTRQQSETRGVLEAVLATVQDATLHHNNSSNSTHYVKKPVISATFRLSLKLLSEEINNDELEINRFL
jgi:hypothetical protein